jgi:hypothetical protein
MKMTLDPDLANEAKALVALAFRNGPIEDLHAGRTCPACNGNTEISHISDEEMKRLMKSAVTALYRLLWQREYDPAHYSENLALGRRYTLHWDDPELKKPLREGPRPK